MRTRYNGVLGRYRETLTYPGWRAQAEHEFTPSKAELTIGMAAKIHPTDPATPAVLAGKRVVFTGKLASMTHAEAGELVRQHDGQASERVGANTDLLVVGEEGWPLSNDGGLPRQLHHARRLKRRGSSLEIISETEFLTRLGLLERQREIHRHYTPAMLARVLDVPITTIRRWERRGLIRPVRRVLKLPYFDFQEVAGAKVLAGLIAEGISIQRIEETLHSLQRWLPTGGRPLMQLKLLADGRRMLVQRGEQFIEPCGQRLFDFAQQPPGPDSAEPANDDGNPAQTSPFSHHRPNLVRRDGSAAGGDNRESVVAYPMPEAEERSAEAWCERAAHLEENSQLAEAVDAFQHALVLAGPRSEVCFHLANVLYRNGQVAAAEQRFRTAVELEPDYFEAWNNLGSVLAELGQPEAAEDAYRCALAVHDDFADAHYNLADTLEELGRSDEAVPHWEAYLRHDTRSPWAEEARRRLGVQSR